MRTSAGGCVSWKAACSGSGVSVLALSSYSLVSAEIRALPLLWATAKASASNSSRRDSQAISGRSMKLNTGITSMNSSSATPAGGVACDRSGRTPRPW